MATTVREGRQFARLAPIALVVQELTAQHITPRAGADDRAIRNYLLTHLRGLPAQQNMTGGPHADTLAWTAPPTPLYAEYIMKGATMFFSLLLMAGLAGIVVLILEVTDSASYQTTSEWITAVLIIAIVQAGLGLLAMFTPDRWLHVDPNVSRTLIMLAIIGGGVGVLGLILLWGVDVHRYAALSYLWVATIAITVTNLIAVIVTIHRD